MGIDAPYQPQPDAQLRTAWMDDLGHYPNAADVFDDLVGAYREPHRRYHTIEHVAEVAAATRTLTAHLPSTEADVVRLAAWTHDVHYDVSASDNEARSAETAVQMAVRLGMASALHEIIRDLVLVSTHRVTPENELQMMICDADLSGLAKPFADYAADVQNIRSELAIDDDGQWHAVRHMILDFFESREPLFYLPASHKQWHDRTLANFEAERTSLPPR